MRGRSFLSSRNITGEPLELHIEDVKPPVSFNYRQIEYGPLKVPTFSLIDETVVSFSFVPTTHLPDGHEGFKKPDSLDTKGI